MTTPTETREYTIDAAGRRLGDVLTEASRYLLGKNDPSFARHLAAPVSVTIVNASQLDIPERKKREIYQRYSGYPSGRKEETLEHLANRLGHAEVVRRSMAGMLPKNRLQKVRLKNLTVTD